MNIEQSSRRKKEKRGKNNGQESRQIRHVEGPGVVSNFKSPPSIKVNMVKGMLSTPAVLLRSTSNHRKYSQIVTILVRIGNPYLKNDWRDLL